MKTPVDPSRTRRAEAFALWRNAPMPMVTLTKTLDVSNLARCGRRPGWKFNLLLCWCIGRAASQVEEFFLLPEGPALMQYDRLAVDVVVPVQGGGISTCDVPFSEDLSRFREDYLRLTRQVSASGRPHDLGEAYMVIGTSALPQTELDSAVNIYAGCYNNPFLIWGRYRRGLWRTALPISFQFHHTQLDGAEAARFLELLQQAVRTLRLQA